MIYGFFFDVSTVMFIQSFRVYAISLKGKYSNIAKQIIALILSQKDILMLFEKINIWYLNFPQYVSANIAPINDMK